MAEHLAVKLKNGEDVVGVYDESASGDDYVVLLDPVVFGYDPNNGVWARMWLMFSEENTAVFYRSDTHYINIANQKAISYYDAFMERMSEYTKAIDEHPEDDYTSDIEDVLSTLAEAYSSTKH